MGLSPQAAQAPTPPKIAPVDIGATNQAAETADIFGYDLSDADFASRFPGLVQARNAEMNQAYDQLTGPLDPTVEKSFLTQEGGNAIAAFGQGSDMPNVTGAGTIGGNTVGAGYGRDVMSYEDTARSNLENLISFNPERSFGLSGGDAANLAISNTASLNNANQLARLAQNAQQNANISASNAGNAATTGLITSIASSILSHI